MQTLLKIYTLRVVLFVGLNTYYCKATNKNYARKLYRHACIEDLFIYRLLINISIHIPHILQKQQETVRFLACINFRGKFFKA